MKLSPKLKALCLRIAAAAEHVARRPESSKPPRFGKGRPLYADGRPCCAGGFVLKKAALPIRSISFGGGLPVGMPFEVVVCASDVQVTNDESEASDRAAAVVKPLRALAEAARKAAT